MKTVTVSPWVALAVGQLTAGQEPLHSRVDISECGDQSWNIQQIHVNNCEWSWLWVNWLLERSLFTTELAYIAAKNQQIIDGSKTEHLSSLQ